MRASTRLESGNLNTARLLIGSIMIFVVGAALIVFYAIAKVVESFDWQIGTLTGHRCAGHALKHIASGLAGGALLLVVKTTGRSGADAAR